MRLMFLLLLTLLSPFTQAWGKTSCDTLLTGPQQDPFDDPSYSHHRFTVSDRPAGGSQGGRWFVDQDGTYYFGKHYEGDEERLIAENLTNHIYSELRVKVPDTFLGRFEGEAYLFSKEVEGQLGTDLGSLDKSDIRENFVIDAWLGNWDVIGQDFDNVLVKDGQAIRVDNGGALFWRAMGGKKEFSNRVPELQSMRDPEYSAGQVFHQLTDTDVAGQIRAFAARYAKSYRSIRWTVEQSGLSPDMRHRILRALDNRAKWLLTQALPKYETSANLDAITLAGRELQAEYSPRLWSTIVDEARVAMRRARGLAKRLSDAEIVALSSYTGGDYDVINEALRGTSDPADWRWAGPTSSAQTAALTAREPEIKLTVSALEKMDDFKGRVERVVELSPQQIARYHVGSVITEHAFTSTTNGGTPPYPGNVTFDILSKHGKNISFMSDSEHEVLFRPGTRFKVVGKSRISEGDWKIQLIEK